MTELEIYADIAVSTLLNSALNNSSDMARIAAATSILDRGYGKPKAWIMWGSWISPLL